MEAKNPVVWFEIYVDDLNRAKNFYEKVLNVTLTEMPVPPSEEKIEMFSFPMAMKGEGAAGALVKMEGVKAGGRGTVVYFSSDDCSIEEARIEEAGGIIYKAKQSLGEYGAMVLAYDTEGNLFGVYSEA